jgi:hypothetical protein
MWMFFFACGVCITAFGEIYHSFEHLTLVIETDSVCNVLSYAD